jgi:RNA polymerase sigma-70 factor (ECF subfamily)
MAEEISQGKKLTEERMVNHPSSLVFIGKFPQIDNTEGAQIELLIRKKFETNPTEGCTLLFRKYYNGLCSHAVRFVYSMEIAEDIVGDIFFDFWKNKLYEQVHHSFNAYLYRTVRNRCLNYLKSNLYLQSKISFIAESELPIQDSPEDILYQDDLIQRINTAINNLPPICRKVFLLHRFEGKKQKEIAKELGLSLRTIEAHVYKALQTLKRVVSEKE